MFNPLNLISKFIKSSNQKELARIGKIVQKINSLENEFKKLNDVDFPNKTKDFKSLIKKGKTLNEILQRKIQNIVYNLEPDFDNFTRMKEICAEDILKVTRKYLTKPFLSIYGDKKICNEINKLWIKNF